jgi:hypothetical protein
LFAALQLAEHALASIESKDAAFWVCHFLQSLINHVRAVDVVCGFDVAPSNEFAQKTHCLQSLSHRARPKVFNAEVDHWSSDVDIT